MSLSISDGGFVSAGEEGVPELTSLSKIEQVESSDEPTVGSTTDSPFPLTTTVEQEELTVDPSSTTDSPIEPTEWLEDLNESLTSSEKIPSTRYSIPVTTITEGASYSKPQATGTNEAEDPYGLNVLASCSPCGSEKCSFSPSAGKTKDTYPVLIGEPVSNCAEGHDETTKTTLGGTFELQESWSVEVEAGQGFGIMGPSLKTVTGIAGTKKLTLSQTIEVSIPPGLTGGLVANISYTKQPGRATIGDDTISLVGINPEFVLGYSVVYTKCSVDFNVLTLPQAIDCAAGTCSTSPLKYNRKEHKPGEFRSTWSVCGVAGDYTLPVMLCLERSLGTGSAAGWRSSTTLHEGTKTQRVMKCEKGRTGMILYAM
ncbi:hypothetical protein BKA70DRAFT_1471107 [Coprinopsis sp. MPI-PUGE-AT-0042]|nr:hypothetical protein BKA70DRAFT_1471107 [Coprinopsis sp. MPI-PUGE-AT-0042]